MKDPTVGYAAMDCVVIPSTDLEGFSNVILEAGSMELPVVASDIPGIQDGVAHGKTGLLVKPNDPSGIVSAVDRVLAEPEEAREWGRNARRRCLESFRPETVWRVFLDIYTTILQRHEDRR